MTLLEVCVDSVAAGLDAATRGAGRLEFCSQLDLDGLTPDEGDLRTLVDGVEIPVFAMVRPRPGDFVVRPGELDRMTAEISMVRRAGASGVVLGVLTPEGGIDESALKVLVEAARDLPVTFHRAFDGIPDPLGSLDVLIRQGVTRLLTSGDGSTAWEGRDLLRRLVEHAGDSLVIMPGGGVRMDHVQELIESTGASEVHSSQVLAI